MIDKLRTWLADCVLVACFLTGLVFWAAAVWGVVVDALVQYDIIDEIANQ